jgi:hypothetical protein
VAVFFEVFESVKQQKRRCWLMLGTSLTAHEREKAIAGKEMAV